MEAKGSDWSVLVVEAHAAAQLLFARPVEAEIAGGLLVR
jgi:hypothetical protein